MGSNEFSAKDFRVLKGKTVKRFGGGRFVLTRDKITLPNQSTMKYHYIVCRTACSALVINGNKEVLLLEQYRHPIKKIVYDVPAGGIRDGETPEQAIRRELLEETGVKPGRLTSLGQITPQPGRFDTWIETFLATDLEFVEPNLEDTEFLRKRFFAYTEVLRLVTEGKIEDMTLLSILTLARHHLENRFP